MHFSTFIPLVISISQGISANPVSAKFAIEVVDYQVQPSASVPLVSLDGPEVPSKFIIRVVPKFPPRKGQFPELFINNDPSRVAPHHIVFSKHPGVFRFNDSNVILESFHDWVLEALPGGPLQAWPEPACFPFGWTVDKPSWYRQTLTPTRNGRPLVVLVPQFVENVFTFFCFEDEDGKPPCIGIPVLFKIEDYTSDSALSTSSFATGSSDEFAIEL